MIFFKENLLCSPRVYLSDKKYSEHSNINIIKG